VMSKRADWVYPGDGKGKSQKASKAEVITAN
jgi:hypothetical protein